MIEKELENIPVPWGHIAAKAWGDPKNQPVFLFHGILDNAGAFDRLISFLPNCFYYICFDLPGHGRSSHFPPYFPIHTYQYLLAYRYIWKYFGKKSYIVIGHSYGSQIAIWYAQIYPGSIQKLVMLDSLYFGPTNADRLQSKMRDVIDFSINLHEKTQQKEPPAYTYDEILFKISEQRRYGNISKEAAIPLIKRGTQSAGGSLWYFTYDQRLKSFMNYPLDLTYILQYLKSSPVTCPVLFIMAKESKVYHDYFKPLFDYFLNQNNFSAVVLEGNHDFHMEYPHTLAPHIIYRNAYLPFLRNGQIQVLATGFFTILGILHKYFRSKKLCILII